MMEAQQEGSAGSEQQPEPEQVKIYASDEGHPATSFPRPGEGEGAEGRRGAAVPLLPRCRERVLQAPFTALALASLAGTLLGVVLTVACLRRWR